MRASRRLIRLPPRDGKNYTRLDPVNHARERGKPTPHLADTRGIRLLAGALQHAESKRGQWVSFDVEDCWEAEALLCHRWKEHVTGTDAEWIDAVMPADLPDVGRDALQAALTTARTLPAMTEDELLELGRETRVLKQRFREALRPAISAEWYGNGDREQADADLQTAAAAMLLPSSTRSNGARALWAASLARMQGDDRERLGVSTGWPALDSALGSRAGWPRGGMSVVAGKTKEGKTSLVMQSAAVAALNGARVLVYNFEMPADELFDRTVAAMCQVPDDGWRNSTLTAEQARLFADTGSQLAALDDAFTILGCAEASRRPDEFFTDLQDRLCESEVDLVVIDHVQKLDGDGALHEVTTRVSRELSSLAASYPQTAVIAASQVSNEVERQGRAPRCPSTPRPDQARRVRRVARRLE